MAMISRRKPSLPASGRPKRRRRERRPGRPGGDAPVNGDDRREGPRLGDRRNRRGPGTAAAHRGGSDRPHDGRRPLRNHRHAAPRPGQAHRDGGHANGGHVRLPRRAPPPDGDVGGSAAACRTALASAVEGPFRRAARHTAPAPGGRDERVAELPCGCRRVDVRRARPGGSGRSGSSRRGRSGRSERRPEHTADGGRGLVWSRPGSGGDIGFQMIIVRWSFNR